MANSFYWFGIGIIGDAAVANEMADILSTFIPSLATPLSRSFFLFIIFGGLAIINIRGVKQGMKVIWLGTALKIIPLILLIVLGFFKVKFHNLQWQNWPSVHNLGEA